MASWLRVLREEFRVKKFGFGDVYPGRFHMWQWRVPPIIYLLYRLTLAVYVDIWMIILFAESKDIGFPNSDRISWAAFLTNWSYFVLALYLTAHLVASSVYYFGFRRNATNFFQRPEIESHENMFPENYSEPWAAQQDGYEPVPDVDMEMEFRLHKLPWYLKIVWILYSVISCAAIMVTLVFFVFLFPQFSDKMAAGSIENVQLHMLNSVIIFIEHLVSGVPIRLLHVIHPIGYGLVYMLFSLFYWIPDHERVMYPKVLDWNNAGLTVGMILLVGFVFFPLIQFFLFIIYRIKLAIFKRLS